MRTVGIICEYNPFHTGHARQLSELRRRFGPETAIVCAMSGNFVQRGDFAIVRKHVRAEAAARGGADLVLELPLPWATASAEGFARGGVALLSAAGAEVLAFGSECADTEALTRVAECLSDPAFPELLRRELSRGVSFAAARQRAAEQLCGAAAELLSRPNDLLGVEYCKALGRRENGPVPLALPRFGADHHGDAAGDYASAGALRRRILGGEEDWSAYLTADMLRLFEAERDAGRAPVSMKTAERAILSRLRSMDEAEFAALDEGREGLYRRFYREARAAVSLEGLLDAVKTKRYAHARLRRMLLRAYLGPASPPAEPPYLRVLAMNARGQALLGCLRGRTPVPVLIKPADVRKLSPAAQALMETEARADDLYALAYPDLRQSAGGAEWRIGPVVIGTRKERKT